MSKFFVIWFGQIVSLIGSGLTSFALGIWVYQHTGSITKFALISAFTVLPNILIAPFAGVIVDRRNRRTIMLFSDFVAGTAALLIAVLFLKHSLGIWEIYLLVGISSIAGVFRLPSYMALLSQLVPPEHIGRASGMMQMGPAATQLLSPILAAGLIGFIGYGGVVLIDVVSFLLAIITLSMVTVPDLPASDVTNKRSLWQEAVEGWRHIVTNLGFIELLKLFILLNITYSLYQSLVTPVILGFTTARILGVIMSTGAIGFVLGGLLLSAWGGPKRRVRGLLGFSMLYSIGLILSGLRPSGPLLTIAVFLTLFQVPIISGCNQAVWQAKTALNLQGRVFAIRTMIGWSSTPLVFFLAGPLADHLFEPLLAPNGKLTSTWLAVIGVGQGRGAALLLVLNGILALTITAKSYRNRILLDIDSESSSTMRAQA